MRQLIMEWIGRTGCYYLSLVHKAEELTGRRIDAVEVYERTTAMVMSDECYIHDPGALMALMAGGTWAVRKAPPHEIPGPGEFEVLRFERRDGMTTVAHFVLGDGSGGVAYDPYGESRTVREGTLISKRIFTQIGE